MEHGQTVEKWSKIGKEGVKTDQNGQGHWYLIYFLFIMGFNYGILLSVAIIINF